MLVSLLKQERRYQAGDYLPLSTNPQYGRHHWHLVGFCNAGLIASFVLFTRLPAAMSRSTPHTHRKDPPAHASNRRKTPLIATPPPSFATDANALPLGRRRARHSSLILASPARINTRQRWPSSPLYQARCTDEDEMAMDELGQQLERTVLNSTTPASPMQEDDVDQRFRHDSVAEGMSGIMQTTDPKTPRRHPSGTDTSSSTSSYECTSRKRAHRRYHSADLALGALRRVSVLAHDRDLRHRRKIVKRSACAGEGIGTARHVAERRLEDEMIVDGPQSSP